MNKKFSAFLLATLLVAAVPLAEAQRAKGLPCRRPCPGGGREVRDRLTGFASVSSSWSLKRENNMFFQSVIGRAMQRRQRRQRGNSNKRKSI